MAELIQSGDTLDTGRIAINNWFSGSTNIFTANTNNTVWLVTGNTNPGSSTFGFAMGLSGVVSSGAYCFIGNGLSNTSSNNFSFIGDGKSNTSSGAYSIVINGTGNTANGTNSFLGNGINNQTTATLGFIGNGTSNRVTNSHSTILNGNSNSAYSNFSLIGSGKLNRITNPSSQYSTILNGLSNLMLSNSYQSAILGGVSNIISGAKYAMVFGKSNVVSGAYSVAVGQSHSITHSHVFGIGNQAISTVANSVIMAAGGGNEIRLKFDTGVGSFEGGTDTGPADYAEYFEWEDGNPNAETRHGLSVTLVDNGKVKISNQNIIGIVSSVPAIVGDAAELNWNKRHKTDDWGIKQTETFDTLSIIRENERINLWIDKDGKQYSSPPRNQKEKLDNFIQDFYELTPEETEKKQKDLIYLFSEEYDPSAEYVPRSERKEFSAIGLLGKIRVKTSEQITAKFIDFNSQGMAINGTQYRVLESIKDYDGQYGIVKVFFK